ncbi:hypothetical protein ACPV4A_19570 [Vibrio rotiferianus]|uniref:hypothetical protein n=1 Tax=Vibrio rotiferianus TaxID=190895 RepID=UPI00406A8252
MSFKQVISFVALGSAVAFSNLVHAAPAFNTEQLCKAALAVAIDKQPRGIKAAAMSGQRVLLAVKNGKNDWDYRCSVNRSNKTVNIDARELARNDKYLGQAIRYRVGDGNRSVEVTMKKRKGSGLKKETFTKIQLD